MIRYTQFSIDLQCLCIVFISLVSALAYAWPPTYTPMHDYMEEAECILSGKVISVEGIPDDYDRNDKDLIEYGPVIIQVEEVIAGEFNHSQAKLSPAFRVPDHLPTQFLLKKGDEGLFLVQEHDGNSITLLDGGKALYLYDAVFFKYSQVEIRTASKKDHLDGVRRILGILKISNQDERIEAMCKTVSDPNRFCYNVLSTPLSEALSKRYHEGATKDTMPQLLKIMELGHQPLQAQVVFTLKYAKGKEHQKLAIQTLLDKRWRDQKYIGVDSHILGALDHHLSSEESYKINLIASQTDILIKQLEALQIRKHRNAAYPLIDVLVKLAYLGHNKDAQEALDRALEKHGQTKYGFAIQSSIEEFNNRHSQKKQ